MPMWDPSVLILPCYSYKLSLPQPKQKQWMNKASLLTCTGLGKQIFVAVSIWDTWLVFAAYSSLFWRIQYSDHKEVAQFVLPVAEIASPWTQFYPQSNERFKQVLSFTRFSLNLKAWKGRVFRESCPWGSLGPSARPLPFPPLRLLWSLPMKSLSSWN